MNIAQAGAQTGTTGDTWGISGPLFLALYAGAFVAIVAGAFGLRWNHERQGFRKVRLEELDDYQVATLSGGEGLAVLVALVRLRLAGVIDLSDGLLAPLVRSRLGKRTLKTAKANRIKGQLRYVAVTPLPVGASPVEQAVYESVAMASDPTPSGVRTAAAARPEVPALRDQLIDAGLMRSTATIARYRTHAVWLFALVAVGLLRAVAGLANGRPVTYLFLGIVATVVTAGTMLAVPDRTFAGRGLLSRAQARRTELRASTAELVGSGGSRGSNGTLTGLALFGTAVLWEADPALAFALDAPPRLGGMSTGSTNSSCGSSSSCGGGGGCGGGGCGGGGCGG